MAAIARLGAVSLDCDDPAELAEFWKEVLGLETFFESDTFVALKGADVLLTFQKVDRHVAADWPEGPAPKQIHLELAVDDLEEAEAHAIAVGAVKAELQPDPDKWRVLIDPAGHPFCITSLIPET